MYSLFFNQSTFFHVASIASLVALPLLSFVLTTVIRVVAMVMHSYIPRWPLFDCYGKFCSCFGKFAQYDECVCCYGNAGSVATK